MRASKLAFGILISIFATGCSPLGGNKIQSEVDSINLSGFLSVEPSVDIPKWKEQRDDFSIIFTGDVMLGRNVENLMNRNGLDYPFELVSDRLNLADEVVINLEGPVLASEKHTPTPPFNTEFSFDEKVLDNFDDHNIGVVNLSNNHTFDKGEEVFGEMTMLLDEKDVDWFGHPLEYDNLYIHTINANGVDVNLLGFNQIKSNPFNVDDMFASVKGVVDLNNEALNIVSLHFGTEYQETSNSFQQEIARAAVEAGADMVIGHHPHVVQEMELYRGVPIFYSLGNFIFDQYFSAEVQEGLAVEMNIEFKELNDEFDFESDPFALLGGKFEIENIGLRLLPFRSIESQPSFLGREEYDRWINEFSAKSRFGNTESQYFYQWSY